MAKLLEGKGNGKKPGRKLKVDKTAPLESGSLDAKISQAEILEIYTLQAQLKEANKTAKKLKGAVENIEAGLIARLTNGASQEDGPHVAEVDTKYRRSVRWKAEFLAKLGQEVADEIEANTPKTPTSHILVKPKV